MERVVLRRLLSRAVELRDDERAAVLLSFGAFFALLSGYYLLRPIREETGIQDGLHALPWLFTGPEGGPQDA